MKLLTILTTADIKAVGPGVWNGWKAQLLRTLYYETEPVLTGGFSEVNRAQRVAMAQAEFRAALEGLAAGAARRLCRAPLSGLLAQGRPAAEARACALRARDRGRRQAARDRGQSRPRARRDRAHRVRARPSVAALDHRRRLRDGRRQHRRRADLHHHRRARARHHRGVARIRARRGRGAPRRARRRRRSRRRCAARCKLPDMVAKRAAPKGRLKAFAIEPEVTINNQWSNRYTMVEVTGLDRPGLLLRADHDAVEAQPQHRLGPRRDLRRARGRRVLRHRPVRREDHRGDPPGRDQARAAAAVCARRARRRAASKGRRRRLNIRARAMSRQAKMSRPEAKFFAQDGGLGITSRRPLQERLQSL